MTKGRIEHTALSIVLFPDDRHHRPFYPRCVFTGICGGRKDLDTRVHMHVILFGSHMEVLEALGDRILVVDDVHVIVYHIARMSNPLAAHHELEFGIVSKGISRSSVPSCEADSILDGFLKISFERKSEGTLCPVLDNQVQASQKFLVAVYPETVGNDDRSTFRLKPRHENVTALNRLMALPATINIKDLLASERTGIFFSSVVLA